MTLDQFMIWRFRNIEGVLDDIQTWNMNECNFKNGSKIIYDLKTDLVTIVNNNSIFGNTTTLPLKECTKDKLIKDFGFRERILNRHNLSYGNVES